MAYTSEQLKGKNVAELRSIAKKVGVNPLGKNIADLIREIIKAEKGKAGKGTAADPTPKPKGKIGGKKKAKEEEEEEEDEEDEDEDEDDEDEEEDEKPAKKGAKGRKAKKEDEDEDDEDEDDEEDEDEDEDEEDEEDEEDDEPMKLTPAELAKMNLDQLQKLIKSIHADPDVLKRAKKVRINSDTKSLRVLRQRITEFLNKFAENDGEDDDEDEEDEKPKKGAAKGKAKKASDEDEEPETDVADLALRVAELEAKVFGKGVAKGKSKAKDEDEEDAEDEDDDDEDEESEVPEHIRVGAKVECDLGEDDEEDWQPGAIESIDEDDESCVVQLDDGESANAPWSSIRARSRKPKKRK